MSRLTSIQSSRLLAELYWIERCIRRYIGSDLSSFWNRDVFAVHEQEQRRRGEENYSGRNHRPGHYRDVIATATAFDRTQRYLLSTCDSDIVDVHVQFPCPPHPAFWMSFGDGGDCHRATLNHNRIANFDVLKDLKINPVVDSRFFGSHGPS